MKKFDKELRTDVEKLVHDSIAAQANSSVWEKFEKAMETLDAESLTLLRRYLRGVSLKQLSEQSNVPESDVKGWIEKIKRELNNQLRKDCKVRQ